MHTYRYHILTWGCQMNEEDSEQIGLFLEDAGYEPAEILEDADVVILNTCSVRRKPEDKVFSKLGELRQRKRENPDLVVGVVGCMAQILARTIAARAPFVDFVAGTGHNAELPELIAQVRERRARHEHSEPLFLLSLPERRGSSVADVPLRTARRPVRLRAFVPVMYGCDRHCTFCVVPFTRGRERSRPPEDIIEEIGRLAAGGTREVILLGQTVNYYGRNLPDRRVTFSELLWRIAEIPGIERIRFTSPHPRGFTDDLIRAIAEIPQVCEHVHLPLQAADDEVLRRMKRGYTLAQYTEIVEKLRSAVPGIAITTDLMVGFPGETEEQFAATLDYVRRTRFDAAFMFAFSPRPGTKAADMPEQLARDVKIHRLSRLVELQNSITAEINRSLVGSLVEVLVEGASARDASRLSGLTRTFKTVHFDLPGHGDGLSAPARGQLVRVKVTGGSLTGLTGLMEPAPMTGEVGRRATVVSPV